MTTLYKYRSWDDKDHKKLLTSQELWIASIASFNDPFDSCVPLMPQGSKKQLKKWGLYKKVILCND